MSETILSGFEWFAALFTLNILAIVAISVAGFALLGCIVFMVVNLIRKKPILGKYALNRKLGGLFKILAWTFLGLSMIVFFYGGAVWASAFSLLTLPIAVLIFVYIIDWIMNLVTRKACCESEKSVTKKEIKEKSARVAEKPEKIKEEKKEAKEEKKDDAEKLREAVVKLEKAQLETMAEEKKPERKQEESLKPVASVEKKEAKSAEVAKPVAVKQVTTKPLFEKAEKPTQLKKTMKEVEAQKALATPKVVQGQSTPARAVTSTTTTTTTTTTATSNTKSSVTELRTKKETLRAEYAKLEKKLEQIRDEKLKNLGKSSAQISATGAKSASSISAVSSLKTAMEQAQSQNGDREYRATGFYSDATSFERTGSGYLNKSVGTQKFDEVEVKDALAGLKSAMDELQKQIDDRETKNIVFLSSAGGDSYA